MVYNTKRRWNQGAPSITRFLSALLAISLCNIQGCSVSGDSFARSLAPANGQPKTSLQTRVNNSYNADDVDFNVDASTNEEARSGVAAEQRDMIDFSFSHVALSRLPAPAELDTNSKGGNTTVVRSSHSMALSLRECSLGDSGVSELASSPWVLGEMSARALSLRQNQVRLVTVDSYSDEIGGRLSMYQMMFPIYFRTKHHAAPVQPSLTYLRIETLRDSADRDWRLSRLALGVHNMDFKFLYTGSSTSTRSQHLRDGWVS